MDKNLIANLIFHKPQIPNFCQDSSVITILNSTNEEKEWVYRTLWAKHFLEINNTIHHLPSDPDYCSFSSLATVLKFQNKYKFDSSERDKIFNEFVVNDHTNEWYDNKDNFTEFDTTNKINNQFINLRDFFDKNTFLLAVSNLFDYFKLGSMNTKLVSSMYDIWWSRQVQL